MVSVAKIVMEEGGEYLCRFSQGAMQLVSGDVCVAELDYGLDTGTVEETETREDAKGGKGLAFRVIRKLTPPDLSHIRENERVAASAKERLERLIAQDGVVARVIHTRLSYGGERLFIRYTAPTPISLRKFAGELQREFRAQPDLWQVSGRDEAKMMGCLGVCGRIACCCSWQRRFPVATAKMARAQNLPVTPAALNGTCGKPKCCIAFECGQCSREKEET